MKKIQYTVKNPSNRRVSITGKHGFTIDANCEKSLSLPDSPKFKKLIERIKREFPFVKFVKETEVQNSEKATETMEGANVKTPSANSVQESIVENTSEKVSLEVFSAECEVKKIKTGEYTATYKDHTFPVKSIKQETVVASAYEQYIQLG